MNTYSDLLQKASREMQEFARTADGKLYPPEWLAKLAARFERASELSESAVARELETLSHILMDSGPMNAESAPSFGVVMDAYQRAKKRDNRR